MHDLIEAFKGVTGKYRLVIAGDADHESDYSLALKKVTGEYANKIGLNNYCRISNYRAGARILGTEVS